MMWKMIGMWHGQVDFGSAFGSGVLAGISIICLDVALSGGLQTNTVMAVFGSSLFVSGLWGCFYWHEFAGPKAIAVFLVGSVIFFAGIAIEGLMY